MDHMDQMIREAANNHHPAYNDKAWEKMEMQLDKHLPQRKDRRRLIFLLLFFLLLGAGTFFVLNNRSGNDKDNTSEKNTETKKGNAASTAEYTAQKSEVLKEAAPVTENTVDNNSGNKQQVPVVPDDKNGVKSLTDNELKPQDGDMNVNNSAAERTSNNSDLPVLNRKQISGNKLQPQDSDAKVNSNATDRIADKTNEPAANKKRTTSSKLKPQNNNIKSGNVFTGIVKNNSDQVDAGNKQTTATKLKPPKANKKNNYSNADVVSNGNSGLTSTGKKRINNKSKTKAKIGAANPSEDIVTSETLNDKKKPVAGKTDSKTKVAVTAPETENGDNTSVTSVPAEENKDKKVTAEETKVAKEQAKDTVKTTEDKKLVASSDKKPASPSDKKKQKNKLGNNFGLTFSVGPDVSFVKLSNTGKTTLTYGAGISYGFAKRFTARTGFYASKKVYEAAPDQYHTPGGNYPYLTNVDAKCNIYEIPVSLSYSFGQRKNHNWFGSVGLSSFIMKKEDYVYNYKTPTGQTYNYYYTANNQNKHYFSVLNLSGGYQYQFNKWLSIQAEPYLQIPLGGVGMGKIKLNSAGILFTVTVKPFAKKK